MTRVGVLLVAGLLSAGIVGACSDQSVTEPKSSTLGIVADVSAGMTRTVLVDESGNGKNLVVYDDSHLLVDGRLVKLSEEKAAAVRKLVRQQERIQAVTRQFAEVWKNSKLEDINVATARRIRERKALHETVEDLNRRMNEKLAARTGPTRPSGISTAAVYEGADCTDRAIDIYDMTVGWRADKQSLQDAIYSQSVCASIYGADCTWYAVDVTFYDNKVGWDEFWLDDSIYSYNWYCGLQQ